MRYLSLDVHQTFCEVAIREAGKIWSAGRAATGRESLELFARSLDPHDEVALEVTGPAMEIARILAPHVARVVVANAQDVRAISHARVKSDRFDARTLADLLAAGMLVSVWVPDAGTQALRRRVARRASLVRQWTRQERDPRDPLPRPARAGAGIGSLRRRGAGLAPGPGTGRRGGGDGGRLPTGDRLPRRGDRGARREARRVGGRLARGPAAIGDVSRFEGPRQLVAYLGLDPKVR